MRERGQGGERAACAALSVFFVLALTPTAHADTAFWQWAAPVVGGIDKAGPAKAFLWIPQGCRHVRGVIFAQNNMEEEMILENPKFRRAMADLGFAEVWVAPAFDLLYHFDKGADETFKGMMNTLADDSGYSELQFAPVIPMGHSAAASMPYYFGASAPDRTLAMLSISGQWPYVRNAQFAPDIWGSRTIDYIPALETMGEYESADTWANEGLKERKDHPLTPLSMAAGPAQSHFVAAAVKVDYLILYIRKAVEYRLPKAAPESGPPTLIPIDPTKTGWLVDRWRKNLPPTASPAPVGSYKGDPTQAFWYFDEEMAQATAAYEARDRGLKVDLVGYTQNGVLVPQQDQHLQVTLKFQPDPDGITFHLGTAFYDTVPGGSPRPANWTGLPVGTPIGHASGGGPISIDRIVGPFTKVGPDTFRVDLQKETIGTEKSFELVFAETHPGDSEYRPAVQQAHMYIPARNIVGADQQITFPAITDQKNGTHSVALNAKSSAQAPVSYYVVGGPAVVEGNHLILTTVPPRSKFPIKVTVVAWQYGRSVEPQLKSAESVERTFPHNKMKLSIMCRIRAVAALLLLISLASHAGAEPIPHEILSPDGAVAVGFHIVKGGVPTYDVRYHGKPVVLESRLGLSPDYLQGFQDVDVVATSHRAQWTPIFGERKVVPDNYTELYAELLAPRNHRLLITFRAYNEGVAIRYTFPQQGGGYTMLSSDPPAAELQRRTAIDINGERTEFRFPPGTFGYEEHGSEGEYKQSAISEIQPWCERPLTLELADGQFASLTEADCENYPRMLLSAEPGVPDALVSVLGGPSANLATGQRDDGHATVAFETPMPWRVLILGDKPGDLLERNYLVANLNPPLALKDTSWIKAGKVMRITTLTTAAAKNVIDFAPVGGFQYAEIDWHWYGTENLDTGDATTVRVPDLDIPEIVRYGQTKNVGLIVYVDHKQIEKQRDILFPLYEKWGVKGVKIGFVNVGPQTESAWITETIQKAAEHHLMLDIHDGYRPTGYSRAFPNLMTVEGVRGNEHMPTSGHNCTLPFTRFVAGPADYTICYYNTRKQTTFAHQLAQAVVYFSPLQFLYWYDKPSAYHDEPEIEFFRHVPTVWDDTKVINGKIGDYATVARRSGDDWFVGTINNSEPRTLAIPLSFLSPGRGYVAHIYSDSDTATTRTHVGIETLAVDAKTNVSAVLRATGGQAIWITPAPAR